MNPLSGKFLVIMQWLSDRWKHPYHRIMMVGAILLLLFLIIAPTFSGDEKPILVASVSEGDLKVSVTEPGEIRAAKANTVVTPRVGWGSMTLTYLVPEGTVVKEGDVVAVFEPGEVLRRKQENESQLNILLADLEKATAQNSSTLEEARANLESQILAFELSKLALEKSKFDAEMQRREAALKFQQDSISLAKARQYLKSREIVGTSDISQIRLKIAQARNALQNSNDEVAKLTLKAPIPGLVVYEISWQTGRKVEKGSQLWPNQPIMQIPDLSSVQSTTQVNEVDISKIKKGQKVVVKLDAFPEYSYEGVVAEVGSVGKSKNNNSSAKVFDVVIDIAGQDSVMKPGMTTSNEIIIDVLNGVRYIPIESIFEEDSTSFVFLKSAFGFRRKTILTGVKNDLFAEVKEGLSTGDEVSLSNPEVAKGVTGN